MKKYWVFVKAEWQKMFEYRGDMILWSLSGAITPLIGLAIWLAVSSSGAKLAFSESDLIVYFIAVIWVNMITSAWGAYFIQESIMRGEFSIHLIKPFTLIESYIANNLSEKIYKIFFTFLLTVILILFFHPFIYGFPVTFFSALLFLISLTMAFVIAFMFDLIIGISSFWLHDNDFLRGSYSLLDSFFSGQFIPLAFLPVLVLGAAHILPFRYMLSFPVEVLLNKVSGLELLFGFTMQFLWLMLTVLVYRLMYKQGIKIYQGYGG
ncbi:ABC-2 family transporter protein [Candidatus Daviesbacteria bacterium]|nr:ABC-2 family transporter protein [Candidatus Daviesbacteria bacterium]